MNFNCDLNRIIPAAASISERIASGIYCPVAADETLAEARLAKWVDKSAQGNSAKFAERLGWDELDPAFMRRLLGADPIELRPAPAWAAVTRDMVAYLAAAVTSGSGSETCVSSETISSVPFCHALLPLVGFGMARLTSSLPLEPLPEAVAACLRVNLLWRLSLLFDLTLGEEFLRFRMNHGWKPGDGEGENDLYLAFTSQMVQGTLMGVFQDYPVLARLAATTIAHWAGDMQSFLISLKSESAEIAHRIFAGRPLAAVRSISSSLSDPHLDGRTVKIIEFEDGRKLVYKPKSLAVDEAWTNLVAWLRQREPTIDLRAPLSWDCGDHGWVEFIEHAPCADERAVRDFYRRAGQLTCLLYAVRATDFHYENLIASGDQPVPIDLETLFVPDFKSLPGESEGVRQGFLGTVLQSLMLPNWQTGADLKTAFDVSGLGSFAENQDVGSSLKWDFCNTNAMELVSARGAIETSRNMPKLANQRVDPGDYLPEILWGFQEAYRAFLNQKEALLRSEGPLADFRNCSARVVLRATKIYALMLRRSMAPRFLVNGIEHSLEFEGLTRAHLGRAGTSEGEQIFRAESAALERLDVPYFDARTDSDTIRGAYGHKASGLLAGPSFDAVLARIASFNEADLEYQSELIRSSFSARGMTRMLPTEREPGPAAEPLHPSELVRHAQVVAEEIERRAIWDGDSADWIGLDYYHEIGRFSLRPVGPSLYSGRGGIGIFTAALHAVTGESRYRRVALAAARSIWRDWLRPDLDTEATATMARATGIGGASGLASLVYALVVTGRLLNEPELWNDALHIAKKISPDDIACDIKYDVLGGSAGAILCLLPLHTHTGERWVLDRVLQCGERLVATQRRDNGWAGGWMTRGTRPQTGFSHGAAGIAFALQKAHEATGVSEFRDAAARALDYERSTFDAAQNNWPDFEPEINGQFGTSWCHGAPGIGMARLGCFRDDDHRSISEIHTAVQWLLDNPASGSDNLCCGEFGNLELLLSAGARFYRSDWIQEGQRRAASAIARADIHREGARDGFRGVAGPCESLFMPGLFNGLAGIGYQMLRLAAPDQVPAILLWG